MASCRCVGHTASECFRFAALGSHSLSLGVDHARSPIRQTIHAIRCFARCHGRHARSQRPYKFYASEPARRRVPRRYDRVGARAAVAAQRNKTSRCLGGVAARVTTRIAASRERIAARGGRAASGSPVAGGVCRLVWEQRLGLTYVPRDYAGRWALITGASSGIGACFAEELARRGAHVMLTARSEDKLNALATRLSDTYGVRAEIFVADLTAVDATAHLLQDILDRGLRIDVLVNNAGLAAYGRSEVTDPARQHAILQIKCGGRDRTRSSMLTGHAR